MATDVWADPAANKGQWILGIPADRLAAVRKLVRVLEGGVLPFPPKEPLVLDSIKATMSGRLGWSVRNDGRSCGSGGSGTSSPVGVVCGSRRR